MNSLLTQALDVLGDVDPDDSRDEARGRRAHARVLAMIEMADEAKLQRREQRIANLLTLAQLGKKDSSWALSEARRLMAEDEEQAKSDLRVAEAS